MNEYPDWLLELVAAVTEFEDTHPRLHRVGDRVSYDKPYVEDGNPKFMKAVGYLIGDAWPLDNLSAHIPDPLRTAAYWYQRGKDRQRALSSEA